jgi:hypothetical protein
MIKTRTATQRYNARMDKIYNEAIKNLQANCQHTFSFRVYNEGVTPDTVKHCEKCGIKEGSVKL